MLKDIVIIDDVLENPDELVEYSRELKYYKQSPVSGTIWTGERTLDLFDIDKNKSTILMNSIFDKLFRGGSLAYKYSWISNLYFHKISGDLVIDDEAHHTDDPHIYSGVVYLNKDPKKLSGTVLFKDGKEIIIENKYNRLALFNSHILHSPVSGFGKDENSRLTLTMFITELDLNVSVANTER